MLRVLVLSWIGFIAACGGSDSEVRWSLAGSGRPAALLSVWGTAPDDVWVVGGRSELAGAPAVVRFDGEAWHSIDSGQRGVDLWWVFGFEGGDVFITGSQGTILRYRNAVFERMTTPRSGTIFGLWGPSADDLWAVGTGDDGRAIVWRYDGSSWRDAVLPTGGVPGLVLKVHGQRTDDVWISCAGGVTLHWDGAALTRMATGVTSSLFSIVTTADRVIAVGGAAGAGDILEYEGAAWTAQPLTSPVPWRGVAAGDDGIYAVGEAGVVATRTDAGWSFLPKPEIQTAFHAAWVDPQGGLWGVGGAFDTLPLTMNGFVAYYGAGTVEKLP